MSAQIGERALMEMYYPPFEAAVDAGVASIMCGYNKINSIWACEDHHTLTELLRVRGKFKGFVMSDWGATHSTAASVKAGLDMEMPGGSFYTATEILAALANHSITIETLDLMATRVLTSVFSAGVMDTPQPTGVPSANASSAVHAALAREIAADATVLLKNQHELLPLPTNHSIAIVGAPANCEEPVPAFGFGWPSSIGCVNSGGGSGSVAPSSVVSLLDAVKQRNSGPVRYTNGSDPEIAAAVAAAADIAIVVVAVTSCEGSDRESTSLPAHQLAYLHSVAAAQSKTVIVVMSPGSLVMDWAASVASILCAFLPGQAQGVALADLLYGDVNPSARLPVTMPAFENQIQMSVEQYPGIPRDDGLQTNYSEGLNVGYRWFLTNKAEAAFLFGSGLSYTVFEYSGLRVTKIGSRGLAVGVNVTNAGDRDGAEVVQLYLQFPLPAGEPPLQLKAFEKVLIPAGRTVYVQFVVSARDMSIWDSEQHSWVQQWGEFCVFVGGQLVDLKQHDCMHMYEYNVT